MKRILMVDDDTSTLFAYSRYFKKKGLILDSAGTLAEGEELFTREDYEIVILDMSLPDGCGLDTIPTLRAQKPNVTIAVVTGTQDPETMEKARAAGADHYFTKPLSIGTLVESIANLVT